MAVIASTLTSESAPTANITGTFPNKTLALGIPQGATGSAGTPGSGSVSAIANVPTGDYGGNLPAGYSLQGTWEKDGSYVATVTNPPTDNYWFTAFDIGTAADMQDTNLLISETGLDGFNVFMGSENYGGPGQFSLTDNIQGFIVAHLNLDSSFTDHVWVIFNSTEFFPTHFTVSLSTIDSAKAGAIAPHPAITKIRCWGDSLTGMGGTGLISSQLICI